MGATDSYFAAYLKAFDRVVGATEVTGQNGGTIAAEEALPRLCALVETLKGSQGRMLFAGNGASAAFASHMTLDWSKNGGVPAVSVNDLVQLTALGNDLGFEEVFAAPVRWHGRSGDLLVTISSSGNSPNVLRAIAAAREVGMSVVTLSGLRSDNASRHAGDINLYVPAKTYGMVECAHQLLLHAWLDCSLGLEEWGRTTIQNMRADDLQL